MWNNTGVGRGMPARHIGSNGTEMIYYICSEFKAMSFYLHACKRIQVPCLLNDARVIISYLYLVSIPRFVYTIIAHSAKWSPCVFPSNPVVFSLAKLNHNRNKGYKHMSFAFHHKLRIVMIYQFWRNRFCFADPLLKQFAIFVVFL